MAKLKNVLSDVEVLCALEKNMPAIRSLHAALVPFIAAVGNWDRAELEKLDKALSRRLKVAREQVTTAFNAFSMERLKALKLDCLEPGEDVDIKSLLTMTWAMNVFSDIMREAQLDYNIPYRVVSSRLGGKLPHSQELERLHVCYGKCVQAHKRLNDKLDQLFNTFSAMTESAPVARESFDMVIEAHAACTDCRDIFMELKDAHQCAYDRIKTRL